MIAAMLALAPQVLGGITTCEIDQYWTKVRDAPLAEAMSLELTTDRREYVVGEAVGLGVVLRNVGSRRMEGKFGIIGPAGALVRIDYGRNGSMVDTIDRATIDPNGLAGLTAHLEPGGSVEGTRFRAVDGGRNRLLLSEPGRYTFRATFCEPNQDLNSIVVSNEVTVEVRPVPDGQEAAWRAYGPDIAGLGEQFADSRRAGDDVRKRALEFVERYPDSVWGSQVRRRLLGFAPDARASDAEKERFERLREAARERGEKRFNGREP